jgi:6-phosphogluconolactonase
MRALALLALLSACSSGMGTKNPPPGSGGAGGGAGGSGGGGAGGGGMGGGGMGGGGMGGAGGGGAGGAGGSGGVDAATRDTSADLARDVAPDAPVSTGNPFVYVSGYAADIRIFQLDMASGALMPRGTFNTGSDSPSYLAWDPSRKYLYAVFEYQNRVAGFSINPTTGGLTRLNDQTSGGDGPAHLSVHASGKWVLSSNYNSGHVAVLPIMAGGMLGAPLQTLRPVPQNAHYIINDRSGNFVFVCATGPKTVVQFKIDAAGMLSPNMPPSVMSMGNNEPRHIAFHPDGAHAYVVNEAGASITSYNYDATMGVLTAPETVSAVPPGANGNGAHVIVHPSGKFVYAAMRGHNSIAIFNVNAAGRLMLVANDTNGGAIRTPRDFTQDPTGTFLLVANQGSANVTVFRINQADGRLTAIGNTAVAAMPAFVGVMPLP